HIAESTGTGAGVAHDHESCVLLLPAFADIRATGLLTHRVQAVVTHDLLGGEIAGRDRGLHTNPVGLFLDRRIRPMRLLRVTRARIVYQVENDCHGSYLRPRCDRRKAAWVALIRLVSRIWVPRR